MRVYIHTYAHMSVCIQQKSADYKLKTKMEKGKLDTTTMKINK